jgi:hypothetical protein
MADQHNRPTVVPFAKGYGVDNVNAQEALRTAAVVLLDHAFADIETVTYGDTLQQADPREYKRLKDAGALEAFLSISTLPPRYEARYQDIHFLKDWAVTITVVGWKLAQARPFPLTNVAEELALYSMINEARATLELREIDDEGANQALTDLLEEAYEDTDFLTLYDEELPAPEIQAEMGFTPVEFQHWFEPFNAPEYRGAMHPYIADSTATVDG